MPFRLAAPILGLGLGVMLFLEGRGLPTAWLPSDEAAVAEQARGGVSFVPTIASLYPLLLRPAAGLLAGGSLLEVGRAMSFVFWVSVAVPAYLLARRGAPRNVAAGAAGLTVVVPAAVYSTALLPEALAYLLVASSFALYAGARDQADSRLLILALACAVAGALVRPWFAVVPISLALASVRRPVHWRPLVAWPRPLALLALAAVAYTGLRGVSPELDQALAHPETVLRAAAASSAAAALGMGILPWILAWAWAAGTSNDPVAERLVFTGPALALAAGVLAGANAGIPVDERPLIAVTPVVFALAARALRDPLPARTLVLSGGALAVAMLALPGTDSHPVLSGAPGLELPWSILRSFGVEGAAPVALALLTAVVGVAFAWTSHALKAWTFAAVACILVAHVVTWQQVDTAARAEAATVPSPLDWIDRKVDTEGAVSALATGQTINARQLQQLALWNRSLGPLVRTDPAKIDPTSGLLPDSVSTPYAVASGLELAGDVVAQSSIGELVRIEAPPRVAFTIEGVYPDNWSGERATYRRFDGSGRSGLLDIRLSRAGWAGPDVPGAVTVSVGAGGREPVPRKRLVIHAGQQHEIGLRVPTPPFEVPVTVEPTFSPADFGQADARQLGAQITFAYTPDRS